MYTCQSKPYDYILNCCFYILTMYSGLLLSKSAYKYAIKNLNVNIDSEQLCQFLCSYSLFFNILVSIYVYLKDYREHYIVDIAGVTILSVGSYLYHYDIYRKFKTRQIVKYNYPENCFFIVFDNICIHIRTFLTLRTNYYYNETANIILTIYFIIQLTSFYTLYENILKFYYDSTFVKEKLFKIINILTIIPISYNIVFIFINSDCKYGAPFVFVSIFTGLLIYIEPFNNLNHFAIHILIIAQNYYSSLANTENAKVLCKI